jgi:hypothetical protein
VQGELTYQLYTSYPGLQQQTWYLTDDGRIAITDGYQCLTETGSGPNYSRCSGGDRNQGISNNLNEFDDERDC